MRKLEVQSYTRPVTPTLVSLSMLMLLCSLISVLYQVLNKQVLVPVPVVQVPVQVLVPNLQVPVPVQILCINYRHSVTLQLHKESCGIFHI